VNLPWYAVQQVRADFTRWDESPAPCGIPIADPYNPCLPENDDPRPLLCLTCGLRQRRAITTGTGDQP
jgi:hypothetical protein